ncbi:MAG: ankyrin repeat protein, partial [Faunusvirus sp.]
MTKITDKKILEYINKNQYDNIIKHLADIDLTKPIYNGRYLIHYVVYHNNIKLFNAIVKMDKNIKYKAAKGTIAHIAVLNGYNDILKSIIDHDYTILNDQDDYGYTPLHILVELNNFEMINFILKKYSDKIKSGEIDINKCASGYNTLLNICILNYSHVLKDIKMQHEQFDIIQHLLKLGADTAQPTSMCPLIYAIMCDNLDTVQLLIKYRANVNQTADYRSSLHYAIKNKRDHKIIKLLLENGADCNFIIFDESIIHLALFNHDVDTIELLLQYDVDLSIQNKYLNLPAHVIFGPFSYPEKIKIAILQKTVDLNVQNIDGFTPLMLILKYDKWQDYKNILVTKKLDIFVRNKQRKMVVDYVKSDEHRDFMRCIIQSYINTMTDESKFEYDVNDTKQGTFVDKCVAKYKKSGKIDDKCLKEFDEIIMKMRQSYQKTEHEIKYDQLDIDIVNEKYISHTSFQPYT